MILKNYIVRNDIDKTEMGGIELATISFGTTWFPKLLLLSEPQLSPNSSCPQLLGSAKIDIVRNYIEKLHC